MATYVTYLDGGRTNAEGFHKYLNRLFTAGVPTFYSATSLAVVQRAAGANLSVDVSVGDVMLTVPSSAYALWGYTDAATNVTIAAADATNPRVDTIVVYGDLTAYSSTSNNPGALKFISVAGTPNGSPVAATSAAIQAAVGANNGWQRLAYVYVGNGATSITNAVITDARTSILPNTSIGANNIANSAITLGYAQITANQGSISSTAGQQVTGLTVNVNIPTGNRYIKITAFCTNTSNNGNNTNFLQIWDGVPGSGTKLNESVAKNRIATDSTGFMQCTAIVQPLAGAKTYNVGFAVDANNATIVASSTAPAFILVEAI